MHASIEDEDREELTVLRDMFSASDFNSREGRALSAGCRALRDLIETRERIERRLRRDELDFALTL